jgi:hypothetical protein
MAKRPRTEVEGALIMDDRETSLSLARARLLRTREVEAVSRR